MAVSRREFLKRSSAAVAAIPVVRIPPAAAGRSGALALPQADASVRELAMAALDAARSAGASYADVRVSRAQSQSVATREDRVINLSDSDTMGFGVRVLVNGAWGFAASRELTRTEVQRVARAAAQQARANRRAMQRPVVLAPVDPVPDGRWAAPVRIDPFTIPIEDKVALLLRANAEALKVQGTRFVNSSLFFLKDERTFASTDGTFTVQTLVRSLPTMNVTAVAADFSDFQSRDSAEIAPMGRGWEHVLDQYRINLVVWPTDGAVPQVLEHLPGWRELRTDKVATTFVRVNPLP